MGSRRAARHVPSYAEALMEPYAAEMEGITDAKKVAKDKDAEGLGALAKMLTKLVQGKDTDAK